MNGAVLVLNASYEPLSIISVRRAVVLLLKEKAELVEAAERYLQAERMRIRQPLVIRLVYFVRVPRRVDLPVTRRTVLARDGDTCQYCGIQPGREHLTIDHVVPRSHKGATSWTNVVTACRFCNQRKGNRTPEQAGMHLLREPYRPQYVALTFIGELRHHEAWMKYLY